MFNLLFVVCVAVALPRRAWRPLVAGVCTVWTCTVAICKMLYQLDIVQPDTCNCTAVTLVWPAVSSRLSMLLEIQMNEMSF